MNSRSHEIVLNNSSRNSTSMYKNLPWNSERKSDERQRIPKLKRIWSIMHLTLMVFGITIGAGHDPLWIRTQLLIIIDCIIDECFKIEWSYYNWFGKILEMTMYSKSSNRFNCLSRSMGFQRFDIELDNNVGVFFPGQVVSGKICILNNSGVKTFKSKKSSKRSKILIFFRCWLIFFSKLFM